MAKKIKYIKYDGDNTELFKKFSPEGLDADSKVIVPETHNAIILKNGVLMETLNSGSYDIFKEKSGKKWKGVVVDIIYLSKTARLQIMWGTKTPLAMRDPETDRLIKAGAHGEMEVQIGNPRKAFLELIGADREYSTDKFRERISMRFTGKIEPAIAQAATELGIKYERMNEHKEEIAQAVFPAVAALLEEYGLKLFSFTIGSILISEEDTEKLEQARAEINSKPLLCPACGAVLERDDKFCPACGANINAKKECPHCGRKNSPKAKFCSGCGRKLK